ncbi:carbon-nitrogen hydrolase family protein [Corynebacterium lowii]|uniref:2-oxoglutaramate amidase n=1 Tax=Corynebacterium lowii TaxID=1544413 RepID=A0A0Q0U2L1_9CORY|nr:carbon-nitrogen hydrolase family protein [Corynebacterium lowii]KQB86110.1 2-oxoglutaramate amidase [Corynebacterium lowii]MDP9852583.1 putative amidohydrolase [Corynebacterium lowii]
MRIALAQIQATQSLVKNLRIVQDYAQRAAERGARMVIFPEATSQAFGTGCLDTQAEDYDGPFATGINDLARSLGLVIVAGMFRPADRTPQGTNRVWNTALIADGGELRGYDKIHTYDAFDQRESETVRPGTKPVTFEIDGVMVGVATCFDLRFPSLFQDLARRGAEVIVVPASWADGPGKLHQWRTLTAARALDTGAFIVASDMAHPGGKRGENRGPTGLGHSAVLSPVGERLVEASYDAELVIADIAPEQVEETRRALPIL